MSKTYLVIQPYYYLGLGTILKEVHGGGAYFVSMSDDETVKSRMAGRPTIEGGVVENDKDHFEDITKEYQDYQVKLEEDEVERTSFGMRCIRMRLFSPTIPEFLNVPLFMGNEQLDQLRKLGNYAVGHPINFDLDGSVDQFKGYDNHQLLEVSPPCANQYIPNEDKMPEQVYKIVTPHPSKWPGALVVSKHKVFSPYGSIPAGTIFRLDNGRMTVNKYMKSLPCSGCGVEFKYMFKGSREAFLKSFHFVSRTEVSDVPLTQAVLLEGNQNEK